MTTGPWMKLKRQHEIEETRRSMLRSFKCFSNSLHRNFICLISLRARRVNINGSRRGAEFSWIQLFAIENLTFRWGRPITRKLNRAQLQTIRLCWKKPKSLYQLTSCPDRYRSVSRITKVNNGEGHFLTGPLWCIIRSDWLASSCYGHRTSTRFLLRSLQNDLTGPGGDLAGPSGTWRGPSGT